ncbi:MAG: hypothetical protein AAF380_02545 [Bacteroidota bacterium]
MKNLIFYTLLLSTSFSLQNTYAAENLKDQVSEKLNNVQASIGSNKEKNSFWEKNRDIIITTFVIINFVLNIITMGWLTYNYFHKKPNDESIEYHGQVSSNRSNPSFVPQGQVSSNGSNPSFVPQEKEQPYVNFSQ